MKVFLRQLYTKTLKDSGLSSIQEVSILWLLQPISSWGSEDMLSIFSSTQGLTAYVWHLSSGGTKTPKIRNHLRAFGAWKELSRSVFSQRTHSFHNQDTQYFSDCTTASPAAVDELLALFTRSTAGKDCALAFLPSQEGVATAWSHMTVGLEWSWLSNFPPLESTRSVDRESIWAAIAGAMVGMSGIVALPWRNTEAQLGFSFLGSPHLLDQVARELLQCGHLPQTEQEVRSFFSRGIELPLPGKLWRIDD